MLLDGKTKGVALIGSEGLHGISALLGANTSNNWAQALIGGTALRIRADVIRQYFEQCRFVQKKYSRISEFISQADFAEGNLQHAPFGWGAFMHLGFDGCRLLSKPAVTADAGADRLFSRRPAPERHNYYAAAAEKRND